MTAASVSAESRPRLRLILIVPLVPSLRRIEKSRDPAAIITT